MSSEAGGCILVLFTIIATFTVGYTIGVIKTLRTLGDDDER